jgi:protein-tyrosine phosphatase
MLYGGRFEVLFVCHANICRSPMAEHIARRAIDRTFGYLGSGLAVSSAGTHAGEGSSMHPGAAQILVERGIDGTSWSSRHLTTTMVADAALVLTAGRTQRSICVEMEPQALRRTFTLRQFARIAGAIAPFHPGPDTAPEVKFRTFVDQVGMVRSSLQPVPASEDDIADPVRQPIEAFRQCAAAIERDVNTILTAVGRR